MSDFWNGEWPNLNNVSISLSAAEVDILTPTELGILYRLVWHIAAQSVHTQFMGPIDDPRFEEGRAHLIARCSKKEWRNARSALTAFFSVDDEGQWRLTKHEFIRLTKEAARLPIPTNVRASVMRRDGQRCVYCGDTEGPFHYDHLWPVSRGGSNEPNNIVMACAPCNLAKGGKTLVEWRGLP